MTASKPALTLRDATLSDLAQINDIHVRSRLSTYRGQVSDQYLDVTMPSSSLEEWRGRLPLLLAGQGCVLIAESDGQPIGFVCAYTPSQGSSYINNLHALPEQKGRGVGSMLLDAVALWAHANGASSMHLKVLESNQAAIGFYESRGWRCESRTDDVWAGETVAALIYVIDLPATP